MGLPAQVAERVLGSIAFTGAPQIAQMGDQGQQLVDAARHAFVGGVGSAVFVASAILLVAAAAVALLAPRGPAAAVEDAVVCAEG